jgi:hypothetical protein
MAQTAHDLVTDFFARAGPWNRGLPGNMRSLTRAQLDLLLRLIGEDEEGGALSSGGPGVTVWKPSGRNKYIIREDLRGQRHTVERLANLVASGTGLLF